MASRVVRKLKKTKKDTVKEAQEEPPTIIVISLEKEMKIKTKKIGDKSATKDSNVPTMTNMAEFDVTQLIAELSENSKVPKGEIENIQKKLLLQAKEILKVNAFANSQPVTEPRIIDCTQKYSNKPVYGRIPIIPSPSADSVSNQTDQNMRLTNTAAARPDNQLGDTQLVPERLQEIAAVSVDSAGRMINSVQENMQRVPTRAAEAGRGVFFYKTGSAAARLAASARAATTRGECLIPLSNKNPYLYASVSFFRIVLLSCI